MESNKTVIPSMVNTITEHLESISERNYGVEGIVKVYDCLDKVINLLEDLGYENLSQKTPVEKPKEQTNTVVRRTAGSSMWKNGM